MRSVLTIDTGGTKTRLAMFRLSVDRPSDLAAAVIVNESEFPTPFGLEKYLEILGESVANNFPEFLDLPPEQRAVSLAIRESVKDGIANVTKLGWVDVPIVQILQDKFQSVVCAENDAKAGVLGAFAVDFRGRGLFLTIGTGIGGGLVINDELSDDLAQLELGHNLVRRDNHSDLATWQSFASGFAFYHEHGHASDITDPSIWDKYAADLATGILAILPTLYPDEIIIGGHMAEYFGNYGDKLMQIVSDQAWSQVANVTIKPAYDPRLNTNWGALRLAMERLNLQ